MTKANYIISPGKTILIESTNYFVWEPQKKLIKIINCSVDYSFWEAQRVNVLTT